MTSLMLAPPYSKICGIRSIEAATAALAAGADYLGFVFYSGSRRVIQPAEAGSLIRALRQAGTTAKMVGLFVNASAEEINLVADEADLDIIQLAGHEPPATLVALHLPVLKTIHLTTGADAASVRERLADYLAAAGHLPAWPHAAPLTFLLDVAVPGHYGGTGQLADWELAAALAGEFPCGLAGGLNPANISAAIAQVRPWLVDVSSGVETNGVKDPAKIRAFLAAVASATTTV